MKTTCEEEGFSKARSREHPFLSPSPSPSSSQSHHMQLFHASRTGMGTACSRTGCPQGCGGVQSPTPLSVFRHRSSPCPPFMPSLA